MKSIILYLLVCKKSMIDLTNDLNMLYSDNWWTNCVANTLDSSNQLENLTLKSPTIFPASCVSSGGPWRGFSISGDVSEIFKSFLSGGNTGGRYIALFWSFRILFPVNNY